MYRYPHNEKLQVSLDSLQSHLRPPISFPVQSAFPNPFAADMAFYYLPTIRNRSAHNSLPLPPELIPLIRYKACVLISFQSPYPSLYRLHIDSFSFTPYLSCSFTFLVGSVFDLSVIFKCFPCSSRFFSFCSK